MSDSIRLSEKHGLNPMLGQCPLCASETNEIFLLGKLRNDAEAPRRGIVPGMSQPCDTCKDHMSKGFLIIECEDGSDPKNPNRTGQIWVVTKDAAQRIGWDVSKGAAFIEHSEAIKVGLTQIVHKS